MLVNKAETTEETTQSSLLRVSQRQLRYDETELALAAADIQQREEESNRRQTDVGRQSCSGSMHTQQLSDKHKQ